MGQLGLKLDIFFHLKALFERTLLAKSPFCRICKLIQYANRSIWLRYQFETMFKKIGRA